MTRASAPSEIGSLGREGHPDVKVIRVPILVNQPGKRSRHDIITIGSYLVIILSGKTQARGRIPIGAEGIFLKKRIGILVQGDFFVRVKFIHMTPLLFPFALKVDQPVPDAGVAQLQPFGQSDRNRLTWRQIPELAFRNENRLPDSSR